MHEEKLIQILKNIGQAGVPSDVAGVAEQTSQDFAAAVNILQLQRPQRTIFVIGLRLLAVAAVILFAFAVGRWSRPILPPSPSSDVAAYIPAMPAYPAVYKNTDSFWQQKALTAMQPRPYAQTRSTKTELLDAYNQYLKEKHYE